MTSVLLLVLLPITAAQYLSQPFFYQSPYVQSPYGYNYQPYQQHFGGSPYQQVQYPAYSLPHYGIPNYYPSQFQQPVYPYQTIADRTNGMNVAGSNYFRDDYGSFDDKSNGISSNQPVTLMEHASYLSLINDKDNFQITGCGWDVIQQKCVDGLGICRGGCRDFAISSAATLHDCRCIPYGYAALLRLAGK